MPRTGLQMGRIKERIRFLTQESSKREVSLVPYENQYCSTAFDKLPQQGILSQKSLFSLSTEKWYQILFHQNCSTKVTSSPGANLGALALLNLA